MRKLLLHLAKWICMRAYWVLPGIFIMLSLLLMAFGKTSFNGYGLLCSLVLGVLCHYATKSWLDHEFDDDEIDFSGIEQEEEIEVPLKQLWSDMTWWERLHWIPILGFLGLTWWAMVKGLGLLFVGGITPFIYAFSTIVVLTLLWLVLMISRKKNIIGFVLFYIVFDAMSAFSFNFVEFYDNISATQHMDRDMKDCRRFSDIQGNCIAQVADRVDELYATADKKEKSLKSNSETARNNAEIRRERARKSEDYNSLINNRRAANDYEARANRLQKDADRASVDKAYAAALKVRVDSMIQRKASLDSLTAMYRNDKQHFTVKEWQKSKNLAQQIGETLVNLSTNSHLKGYVQLDSTEVSDIMRHLKSNDQDRFASLNKLFKALAALFDNAEKANSGHEANPVLIENKQVAMPDSVASKAPIVPVKQAVDSSYQDQQFENRLLYLSIMLSVLIDLLPLALGVFVAYSRRRRRKTQL